jgi:hypothetical protein
MPLLLNNLKMIQLQHQSEVSNAIQHLTGSVLMEIDLKIGWARLAAANSPDKTVNSWLITGEGLRVVVAKFFKCFASAAVASSGYSS